MVRIRIDNYCETSEIIDVENDTKFLKVLKQVYKEGVDHVHLEFGNYNSIGNFESQGEVIIPFKKGIAPFVWL